jgi:hypothetical protein
MMTTTQRVLAQIENLVDKLSNPNLNPVGKQVIKKAYKFHVAARESGPAGGSSRIPSPRSPTYDAVSC